MESTNKATCPQCGAQGTAGRYCEYCGTKIPEPEQIIETKQEDDNTPFSWYNVVPVGYKISEYHVVGDRKKSLFMIVESRDEERSEYGIINRQGKFVVDCNKGWELRFYPESSYCTDGKSMLKNLVTGETLVNEEDKRRVREVLHSEDIVAIIDRENERFSLFDMKSGRFIELPSELSDLHPEYDSCDMSCVFHYDKGVFELEKKDSDDDWSKTTVWNVKIEDEKAEIIDCNVKITDKKAWAAEAERRAAEAKAKKKKAQKKSLLIIMAL